MVFTILGTSEGGWERKGGRSPAVSADGALIVLRAVKGNCHSEVRKSDKSNWEDQGQGALSTVYQLCAVASSFSYVRLFVIP